ncbi:TPA: hypothetical protein ACX6Q6_003554 [Photobacterium damselae]
MNGELVSHTLPNLVNGVSEQSPKVRLESQSQDEVNTLHDVSRGLRKRLPTNRDVKLPFATDDSFIHYVDKGMDGLFAIVIDNKNMCAVNLNTQEPVPIYKPDFNYLDTNGGLPRKSFSAISVGDATWILNKNKVVAKGSAISGNAHPWAAMKVQEIACDVRYNLTVTVWTGTKATNYSTTYTIPRQNPKDSKQPMDLSTVNVPQSLYNGLKLPAGVNKAVIGGDTLLVWCNKGQNGITKITMTPSDSMADTYSTAFGQDQTVGDFTELPTKFMTGMTVKVKGDTDTSDDYYVTWKDDGVWHETLKDGEQYELDANTMPWRLNLQWGSDSKPFFDFVAYKWTPRVCGDVNSNLFPSFVGNKCTDIFFHKNRLGLISATNVILSEDAKYQNFFLSTMRTGLDTDMIDIASPTCELTELSYAVPFSKEMILFSPKTQFALESGTALTPKSVALLESSKYESDTGVRPISVGSSLFYATKLGRTSSVWEMTMGDSSTNLSASDVGAHVPTFIKGSVTSMTGTSLYNKLCVVAFENGVSNVYIYSFLDQNGNRMQSAWTRWHLDYAAVTNARFLNSKLYFVVKREDGYYVEHTHMDADPLSTELTLVPHLDSLREVNNKYVPVHNEAVYHDRSVDRYFAGVPYSMEYTFSEQVLRQGNDGAPVSDARLQLRNLIMSVKDTGEFEVQVTPEGRPTKIQPVGTRIIGGISSILSPTPTLLTDDRKVSINSNSHTVKIKVVSDKPYPLCIQAAAYKGLVVYKSASR